MSLHDELRQLSPDELFESYKAVLDSFQTDPDDVRGQFDCLGDYPALFGAVERFEEFIKEGSGYPECTQEFVIQGMVIAIAGLAVHSRDSQAATLITQAMLPDTGPDQD